MPFFPNTVLAQEMLTKKIETAMVKAYAAGYADLQANTPVITENLKKSEGWGVYRGGQLIGGMAVDNNGDSIEPPRDYSNEIRGQLSARAAYALIHFRGAGGNPGNPAFDNAAAAANFVLAQELAKK